MILAVNLPWLVPFSYTIVTSPPAPDFLFRPQSLKETQTVSLSHPMKKQNITYMTEITYGKLPKDDYECEEFPLKNTFKVLYHQHLCAEM